MLTVDVLPAARVAEPALREIHDLLLAAFGGDFSAEDWSNTAGGTHVVVRDAGAIVAHAAVVPRVLEVDGRPLRTGYVEGVATAPGRQGTGLGTRAMDEVNRIIGSGFDLGALSTGEHHFYERVGWVRWRGPTYVRAGGRLLRTEAEDDGIMVLCFGSTAALDLTAPISCEARDGDAW